MSRSNGNNWNFERHNHHNPQLNSYSRNENRRSNYGPVKNQSQRSYDQRRDYNDNQTYNGGRGNRNNNYSNQNRNNDLSERARRGGPSSYHQSLRGSRTVPYDPIYSRSRQSSVRPHSRVRLPAQEDQEMIVNRISNSSPPELEDNILAGWSDDHEKEIDTSSSNSADDDDSIDWHVSETSPDMVTNARPISPLMILDKEDRLSHSRDYRSRNRNRSRSRSRSRSRNRNQHKEDSEDNNEVYKGVSFLPPFPMVPVSSTADLPMRPKISPRIFENDSQSSAYSFEKLAKVSTTLWKSHEDVPLALATKEADEYDLMDVGKEDDNRLVPPQIRKQSSPKPRNGSREERDQKQRSTPKKSTSDDYGYVRRLCFSGIINQQKIEKKKKVEVKDKVTRIEETTTVLNTEARLDFEQIEHSTRKKSREEEHIHVLVNNIYRTNNTDWLPRTLAAANEIIPKITLFDTETVQNFLKMLSSNVVLNKNNKDAKRLFSMIIKEPSFFEKIFSYMKREIHSGGDLLLIIRLTNFIVKLFPDAAQHVPCNDIKEVCTRVEGTFSEAESNEANQKLEDIMEYRFRAIRDVEDRRKIDYHNKYGIPYQAKAPLRPLNAPKPDWISSHRLKYVKKSLIPSPEEIFDLEAMLTMPKLTPHLVDQSWLPEYEDIYRQVHFDLLRAEVVEDLQRSSVAFFAANCQDYSPRNSPFYNYVFYYDVRIESTNIGKEFNPYVRVGFKTSKSVDWNKGEHLIYGTFILLFKVSNASVDKSSMTCAMVEYSNLDDVTGSNGDRRQEKFVGLTFSESEFDKLDLNGKYIMLESTRNYVSIRPVMEWLEEKDIQKNFPLCQELFTCCTDNKLPGYLENVPIDITSILVDQRKPIVTDDRLKWPSYKNSNNDSPAYNMELSCVVALRQIISRKVAVIMAPVVTSKAKVASKAVEFLNRALRQSQCFEPIIIITSSSYALDSILEKLLPSFPDLVRCGTSSKCNPILESRQIQDVANEYLNSRRSTLFREWTNIRREMTNIQEELTALWNFRKHALSTQYFIESSPQGFRDQLIPASLKRNNGSNKLDFIHCFELWLAGASESDVTDSIFYQRKVDIKRTDRTNQSFDFKSLQDSPSLFTKLAGSYLFENDWTKTNGCYEDDSISSAFEDQINDRVIFKSEEGNFNRHNNFEKYRTKFINVANEFWCKSGPNIWTMKPDERKSLYNNFHQRHIDHCDQSIRELQKRAILQAERVKSVRMARWAEVCNFAQVVGMTMSFAIENREVIGSLKPRVCIVDEASEIPESMLMFLIASDRLEHLIMFGDLQYSKPDVKSKTAQNHGLSISLFERWIKSDREDYVSLKQQSRMHPTVRELVRVLYDETPISENESQKRDIPKIMGVPSHVFFMTHDNFDRNARSFSTNTFEAEFIINFAFYLYQQGYDPAKITILTPYFAQKRLILGLLKPELKQERPENIYGRFDKERNKTGTIKVELIDNYHSYENEIVLLSLVTVNEKWHGEALKTLNNKKRAIIALSRAIHALYIFGNEKLLLKSEIWAPVVKKLKSNPNTYGKSLVLSCNTHIRPKIEIASKDDFATKVPYGGCSEPCRGLLKCGHACQRMCHPIHHTNEVDYVCHRPCGGQNRPEECEHECPKSCYECERSGKCPPCDQIVKINLRCGHTKSIPCHRQGSNVVCEVDVPLRLRCEHIRYIKCYQKDNEEILMTIECKEVRQFWFPNCNHRARLPCSTRSPVCKETCAMRLPCGHRCQRQCGVEHSHRRSDCLNECPKTLICGHMCANGCSDPDRHTSFCIKHCRIKCLHGSVCPKYCYETCTKCLEPCPWKCPHYTCRKKCNEPCSRPPCQSRCFRIFKCNHQCNGYCGEECPPCLKCNPDFQCKITLQSFDELYQTNPNERLYVLPECRCVFTADGLDLYFENQVKFGEHTAVKLWQCPSCQEPIFTAMRYNHYLKTEISIWNVIKRKQELARCSISTEERRQIINAMNEETRTSDLNSMVGGRWFVCPNNHPYYIGNCGGATQVSRCPECSETIGGMQHKVVSTNRFYGEFDNSASPAWPGQH